MRAKEKFRLGVIRMALAEIKRVEVVDVLTSMTPLSYN